jgi:hypothetical protein
MEEAEDVIASLAGEVITGGSVEEDGFHLYTQNGLILIFVGVFGILKTDDTVTH